MKKKILLLPSYFPSKAAPIVGSQIQEQAELLAEDFDIVVLYCLPGIGWRRHLWNRLTSPFKPYPARSCTSNLLTGKLRVRGNYYFQSARNSEKRNEYWKVRAYTSLFEDLLREGWKPDLIHARGHESGGVVAGALKEKFRIPFVLTENVAFVFDDHFSGYKMAAYKGVINRADVILYVSTYLMRITLLHGLGLKSEHRVVGNWIDENRFAPLPSLPDSPRSKSAPATDDGRFRIFTTGYNSYIKDFITFFRAIRQLIDRGHQDIRAIIAVTYYWSQENKDELPALAASQGIADYCEFVYQIPREEMPRYYNDCDVYVCTSLTETFGIASAEALFCGKPVISTDNGGASDFIDRRNGMVVGLRDHVAIADAILSIKNKQIAFDPAALRASVLDKFGARGFLDRHADAYQLALRGSLN
ncbi:MAG: glycosyltransferase [Bacteroidota bacterium]|nr:glycosyltransferase [Bacteroidota bacterium]MDP4217157.1 glycosyltransferase [Bacteroidota bacterium]MDP4244425.1 glycosyltransferase [Bacteroidota bacterium]MDP4256220.1 glycosyltransferase [Bacteroidota bacterium]MDP4260367.1 glycosyltransferase [Bacteroidota bacterium]